MIPLTVYYFLLSHISRCSLHLWWYFLCWFCEKVPAFWLAYTNFEVCLYQELLILQLVPQQEICVRSNFIFIESIMIKATMLFLIMITLLLRNSTRVLCIRSNITPPPAVSGSLRILLPSYCSSLSSSSSLGHCEPSVGLEWIVGPYYSYDGSICGFSQRLASSLQRSARKEEEVKLVAAKTVLI